MIKRFVALILILGMCCFAAGASANSVSSGEFESDIKLLLGLGIADSEISGNITRGEYAQYISNIINYRLKPQNTSGHFTDVSENHINSGAIYNLAERGYISGKTENIFDPDSPILFEQALKIIINAAGFGVLAESYGEYPLNYLRLGAEYGFTKGISKKAGDYLECGEAAKFLANALKQMVPVQNGFGSEQNFILNEEKTMLSEFMGIKFISGIMTDNGLTSLTGKSRVAQGCVLVDNTELKSRGVSFNKFLGCLVDAYVTNDDEREIIYIDYSYRNKIYSVLSETLLCNDSRFSLQKIVYEDIKGAVKAAQISPDADFILNNSSYPDVSKDDLCITLGEIILIDNNSDGVNEVVLIRKPEILSVSSIDTDGKKIFCNDGKITLDLSNTEFYSLTKNGNLIDFPQISKNDIISAYINVNKDVYEISVTTRKVSGKITSITHSGSYIDINGEPYTVLKNGIITDDMLGGTYSFLLDNEGKIVEVLSSPQNNVNIAMLRDVKIEKGLNGQLEVKLLGTDGKVNVVRCSNNISVDSLSGKDLNDLCSYLQFNAKNKLIKYELDKNGLIFEIRTAFDGKNIPDDKIGELQLYQTGEKLQFSGSQYCFGGKALISSNTIVFLMPESSDEDELFKITDTGYFNNTSSYVIDAYTIGAENGFAEYIVCKTSNEQTYTNQNNPILVDKITKVLSEDGDVKQCLKGYSVSGEVSYISANDEALKTVKSGDIIRCILNINKEIIFAKKVYDGTLRELVNDVDGVYFSDTRSFAANVYAKFGKAVALTKLDPSSTEKDSLLKSIEYFNLGNAKIFIYDKSRDNHISQAQSEDLKAYCDTNVDFSNVYIYTYSSLPKIIVIYK